MTEEYIREDKDLKKKTDVEEGDLRERIRLLEKYKVQYARMIDEMDAEILKLHSVLDSTAGQIIAVEAKSEPYLQPI